MSPVQVLHKRPGRLVSRMRFVMPEESRRKSDRVIVEPETHSTPNSVLAAKERRTAALLTSTAAHTVKMVCHFGYNLLLVIN